MTQFDFSNIVDGGLLKLHNLVDASTATPTVQLKPVSALTPTGGSAYTEVVVTLSANKVNESDFTLLSEQMYLTGGTQVVASDGTTVMQYTASVRGLSNNFTNNPPLSGDGDASRYKAHQPNSVAAIPEGWAMRNLKETFESATTQVDKTTGEALFQGEGVSIHTDGNIYRYNSSTYPSLVGLLDADAASGATGQYKTWGGLSTGHTGLTIGATLYVEEAPAAPTTPSGALAGAAGNLSNGDYKLKVTYVTAEGETLPSTESSAVTVADNTVDGQIDWTFPVSTNQLVTSRKLYRTIAGGSAFKLLTTIANNTGTTYTDNTADGSLGADAPTAATVQSAVVETSSTTAKIVGQAESATTIRLALSGEIQATSDSDWETGTSTDQHSISPAQLKGAVEVLSPPSTIKSILLPSVDLGSSFTPSVTATSALFTYFILPAAITVNRLTFKTSGTAGTNGTFDMAIYSEDGQTKHFEETTASITATNTEYQTSTSSAQLLPAGAYYIGMVGNVPASKTFVGSYGTDTLKSPGSDLCMAGTAVVSSGVLPATFDPTALTDARGLFFRLDN